MNRIKTQEEFDLFWQNMFRRYKGGKPKSVAPPALPPPAATPTQIIEQAGQAGQAQRQGRTLRRKTSRATSQVTRPSLAFQPAQTAQAGLQTKLGGT